ncbi:MAG: FecR family protein [Elusimicrobiota bacterium]
MYFVLCLLLLMGVPVVNSQDIIYKTSGTVEFYNDKNEKINLKEGDVIGSGYSIITSSNSEAQLLLENKSMVFLFENTKFILKREEKIKDNSSFLDFIFGVKNLNAEENSLLEKSYNYLIGKATFFINKMSKEYKVKTPQAVCGVRGTNFSIISDEEHSEIGLFKGLVDIEKDGEVKTLKPGQSAYITKIEIKIQHRLSTIMMREKQRAKKLEKYFENVRKKLEERDKKIKEKIEKRQS